MGELPSRPRTSASRLEELLPELVDLTLQGDQLLAQRLGLGRQTLKREKGDLRQRKRLFFRDIDIQLKHTKTKKTNNT